MEQEKKRELITSAEQARILSERNQMTTEQLLEQIGYGANSGQTEIPIMGRRPSETAIREVMNMGFSQRKTRDFNGMEILIFGW